MEDDLKEKGMGFDLYLNNVLKDSLLASNDAYEKQCLDSLGLGPIGMKQTQSPKLLTIEDHGTDNCIQEVHLAQDVLELVMEAPSLEDEKGSISLVELIPQLHCNWRLLKSKLSNHSC